MTPSEEAILMLASYAPENGRGLTPRQIVMAVIERLDQPAALSLTPPAPPSWMDALHWCERPENDLGFKHRKDCISNEAALDAQCQLCCVVTIAYRFNHERTVMQPESRNLRGSRQASTSATSASSEPAISGLAETAPASPALEVQRAVDMLRAIEKLDCACFNSDNPDWHSERCAVTFARFGLTGQTAKPSTCPICHSDCKVISHQARTASPALPSPDSRLWDEARTKKLVDAVWKADTPQGNFNDSTHADYCVRAVIEQMIAMEEDNAERKI